eukprot:m.83453 g.83453  ORF g.83453 m.83453 type:complete len:351 (+) comp16345_c0_seq2:245-1297(+)
MNSSSPLEPLINLCLVQEQQQQLMHSSESIAIIEISDDDDDESIEFYEKETCTLDSNVPATSASSYNSSQDTDATRISNITMSSPVDVSPVSEICSTEIAHDSRSRLKVSENHFAEMEQTTTTPLYKQRRVSIGCENDNNDQFRKRRRLFKSPIKTECDYASRTPERSICGQNDIDYAQSDRCVNRKQHSCSSCGDSKKSTSRNFLNACAQCGAAPEPCQSARTHSVAPSKLPAVSSGAPLHKRPVVLQRRIHQPLSPPHSGPLEESVSPDTTEKIHQHEHRTSATKSSQNAKNTVWVFRDKHNNSRVVSTKQRAAVLQLRQRSWFQQSRWWVQGRTAQFKACSVTSGYS